ncbi:MAG TPA: Crp/Fnr family transcriptional regulator [Sphingomicrobium sp.]|nr:Crp/Fnr family transcriptional regulator [Sphingomicrobium sp.]
MAANPLACASCPVRDRAACAALDDGQRGELSRLGFHRSLKRGDTLFHAGDDSDHCATLISGALKIAQIDAGGTEHILALVHPAGFVGELFAPVAHHDVIALTDSKLCVFPRRQYEEVVTRFPALGRALLRRSSEDLFESRALMALMTGRTAGQRVAGFLLAAFAMASSFDLPVTRGEIASLLGLTIETVSRQLTRLEKDRVITRNGARGIDLLDAARLGTLAAG